MGRGDGQGRGGGGAVHVVELDDEAVLDHLVDDVGAEVGDAARVALRTVAVDGQCAAVQQRSQRAVDELGQWARGGYVDLRRVLVGGRARREVPEAAGLVAVA